MQIYLEELFGLNKCYGCKYEPALYGAYENVNITDVLDVGAGGCGVVCVWDRLLRTLRLFSFHPTMKTRSPLSRHDARIGNFCTENASGCYDTPLRDQWEGC